MADRPPVIAAWGAGVDSTAMIVELADRGEPMDMVLYADPGAEKSATYAFNRQGWIAAGWRVPTENSLPEGRRPLDR